jgi:hypothetical protein
MVRFPFATMHRLAFPPLTLLTAACTSTAPPPAPAVAPSPVATVARLPDGTGCAGEVSRFRAVMQNDLQTGHVARRVYDQVTAEIDRAAAACAAGRDAEGVRLVRATKSRFGYP